MNAFEIARIDAARRAVVAAWSRKPVGGSPEERLKSQYEILEADRQLTVAMQPEFQRILESTGSIVIGYRR